MAFRRRYAKRRKFYRKFRRNFKRAGGKGRSLRRYGKGFAQKAMRIPKGMYAPRQAFAVLRTTYSMNRQNLLDNYAIDTVIKGNSLKDTVSNGQDNLSPPFWQLCQLYSEYNVYKSKITVQYVLETSSGTLQRILILIRPDTETLVPYTSSSYGFNSTGLIPLTDTQDVKWRAHTTQGFVRESRWQKIGATMKTSRIFKKKTNIDPNYNGQCIPTGSVSAPGATVTAPAEEYVWHVWLQNLAQQATGAAGDLVNAHMLITVHQYVRFFNQDTVKRTTDVT